MRPRVLRLCGGDFCSLRLPPLAMVDTCLRVTQPRDNSIGTYPARQGWSRVIRDKSVTDNLASRPTTSGRRRRTTPRMPGT